MSFTFFRSILIGIVFISASGEANFNFQSYASENSGRAFLYQDNQNALEARIAMLQSLPSGASVKIATFVFEYGKATQALVANICHAAKRGVNIDFIIDSKYGDRVDALDAFNGRDNRKNEERNYGTTRLKG